MSKVSDFGKKISDKTKEISQKAKIYSEASSLNNVVKAEEEKINAQYNIIGKLYFENMVKILTKILLKQSKQLNHQWKKLKKQSLKL